MYTYNTCNGLPVCESIWKPFTEDEIERRVMSTKSMRSPSSDGNMGDICKYAWNAYAPGTYPACIVVARIRCKFLFAGTPIWLFYLSHQVRCKPWIT